MSKLALVALVFVYSAAVNWPTAPPSLLTNENYRHKFDEVMNTTREGPGALVKADLLTILGPGDLVPANDPDVNAPLGGLDTSKCTWLRWTWANEALVAAIRENEVVTVVRFQR